MLRKRKVYDFSVGDKVYAKDNTSIRQAKIVKVGDDKNNEVEIVYCAIFLKKGHIFINKNQICSFKSVKK